MINSPLLQYYKLIFLLCFLSYSNTFAQLSDFSDEFDDPTTIENWNLHNSGPLSANYYETLILSDSLIAGSTVAGAPLGQLTLIPGPEHCGWFANVMGPMLSREVTGNFVVSTYVTLHNKNNYDSLPTSDYNAAGIIARNPNTQDNENYVITNLGFQSYENGIGTETKTTLNGESTLYLNPDSSRAEIRMCRVGDMFRTYKRNPTDESLQMVLEINRADLPPTLQVGLMANGWDPTGDAAPNVRAEYDYIRYQTVESEAGCTLPMTPNDCSEAPYVDAGLDVTICVGESWELTAIGGINYQWSNNETGLSDYAIVNPIASPTVSTTYYVTVTHENGCTNTDSVHIEVEDCEAITCSALAYEGFEYENGLPLHLLADGTGWEAPWVVQDASTAAGFQTSTNTVMSYLDMNTEGGALLGGTPYTTAGRRLNVGGNSPFVDYLEYGTIGADGTTLYVSCLLRKSHQNDQPITFDLHGNNVMWNPISPRVGVGYFGTDSNGGGIRYWSLRIDDTVYPTPVPIQTGETALAVLEIQFDATNGNTVNLFLNPETLGEEIPLTPTLTQTANADFRIRSVATHFGSHVGQGIIDEIRFANSYACATPDASIQVNLPPIAHFTADVTTGTAPFAVNFDASSSTDDEGIVNYEWILGDGTHIENGGLNVSHTYNHIGVLPVTLWVTDQHGSQHFYTTEIVVSETDGGIPCQTALRLYQPATCGEADGVVTFYDGYGTDYVLTNTDGNPYPPTFDGGFSYFADLPSGSYTLEVTGDFSCTDSFDIEVPTDSTTCAGWYPDDCRMQLGVNLEGLAYWTRERPFKNLFLQSSPFYASVPFGGTVAPNMEDIEVDDNGYPIEIPQTTAEGPQQVSVILSSLESFGIPLGNYILLYDGEGTLQMGGGGGFTDVQPGRIEFTVAQDENLTLTIASSQFGNHIRNIRILRPEHEFADLEANPFYEAFLGHAARFKALRFMNWQGTNSSNKVNWEDRKSVTYHTQESGHGDWYLSAHEHGVAYEYIAQLCNILQKDAWICVPHSATDDYIAQMAAFFRDNLDEDLTIYLEYSNEVWNWQFTQAHWVDGNRPLNLNYPRAIAEYVRNTFEIWYDVFDEDSSRVKRVLGTQAGYLWVGEQMLAQIGRDNFDYFSPTWYFGLVLECTNEIWESEGEVTPQDVITCVRDGFHAWHPDLRQNFWNAQLYGKPVIGYEGGHHITTNGGIYPYQQAVYDAHIAPEMYDLYHEVMDTLNTLGMDLGMAFTLVGRRDNPWGAWGHLEDIDQDTTVMPAPKYQALIDQINLCQDECVPSITLYPPTHNVTNMNRTWTVTDSITTRQYVALTDTTRHHRVRYQAGQFVEFLPGFETELDNNSAVEVVIEDCGGQAPVAVSGNKALWEKTEDDIGGQQNLQWKLYPNPAENFAFVEFSLEESESALLEVFDLQGNVVTRLFYNQVDAGVPYRLQLELENLVEGIYVVQLSTKSGVREVKKLVTF